MCNRERFAPVGCGISHSSARVSSSEVRARFQKRNCATQKAASKTTAAEAPLVWRRGRKKPAQAVAKWSDDDAGREALPAHCGARPHGESDAFKKRDWPRVCVTCVLVCRWRRRTCAATRHEPTRAREPRSLSLSLSFGRLPPRREPQSSVGVRAGVRVPTFWARAAGARAVWRRTKRDARALSLSLSLSLSRALMRKKQRCVPRLLVRGLGSISGDLDFAL